MYMSGIMLYFQTQTAVDASATSAAQEHVWRSHSKHAQLELLSQQSEEYIDVLV